MILVRLDSRGLRVHLRRIDDTMTGGDATRTQSLSGSCRHYPGAIRIQNDPNERSTIYYCTYGWDITLTTRFFLEHDVLNSNCTAAFFTLRVPTRCAASFSVEKLAFYDIIDRRQSAGSSFFPIFLSRASHRTPPLRPTFRRKCVSTPLYRSIRPPPCCC